MDRKVVKKKVVVVVPKLAGGGVERVMSIISRYAPDHIDLVFVLFYPRITYQLRGTVYVIGGYSSLLGFLKRLMKLQGILLKERPNAILGCEKGRNLVLFTIGFKRFSRMETYPGVYLTTRVAKIIHWLKVKVLYRRSTIIAISHGIKQAFVEKYGIPPENVVVIYNPCDLSKIRTLSEEPLEPELIEIFKNPVILNVGRIVKGKGQWHLIRAFSLISKEYPDSRLVIVGDGLLRGYLEKLIKGLGLEGKVFILGFKPNPFKYMKGAFLFAFPSLVEGCPNVLIEALACRLPVIAADCPSGPREILNPGTRRAELRLPEYGKYGILMPVMDGKFYSANDPLTWQEEVWASEIIKCLETPKVLERYRKTAIQRAKDFDAKKQVEKYFEVLLEM